MRELAGQSSSRAGQSGQLRHRMRGRRAIAAVTALLISGTTVVGVAGSAWADKKPVIPSQSEVDKAKADAKAKAAQVGDIEAQLAAANTKLTQLNDQVEIRVEAYNGAQVKLAAAQKAVDDANAALAVAEGDRKQAQQAMNQLAVQSYQWSPTMGEIGALVSSGSPEQFLNQQAMLAAISRHQDGIIANLKSAEAKQDAATKTADQALDDQQKASEAAAKAKDDAVKAMNDQTNQVAEIQGTQNQLQAQLLVLQGKAKDLADARAKGLAELAAEKKRQEEAAARAAAAERARLLALQQSGGSSSGSGAAPVDLVTPGTGHSVSTPGQRATAVAFAQSKIGIWYRWAGAGEVGPTVTSNGIQNVEGYDCSGLTMRAYQAAGISLGHYTGLQWDEGMHVSRDQLQPGDLVFFATNTSNPSTIHHVGIYIGGGKMIDAPETGRQVGVHNAFRPDYIGAVRP